MRLIIKHSAECVEATPAQNRADSYARTLRALLRQFPAKNHDINNLLAKLQHAEFEDTTLNDMKKIFKECDQFIKKMARYIK